MWRRCSCRTPCGGYASAARTLTPTPGAPGAPGRMLTQPSSTGSEHADSTHGHPLPPRTHLPPCCTSVCTRTPRAGGHPPGVAAIGTQRQPSPSLVWFGRGFLPLSKSWAWLYYNKPRLVFVWGGGCWASSLRRLQLGTPQAGVLPALPFCSRCPDWLLPRRGSQACARPLLPAGAGLPGLAHGVLMHS